MFFNKKLFAHENVLSGDDGTVRGAGRRRRTRCCVWADDPGRKGWHNPSSFTAVRGSYT